MSCPPPPVRDALVARFWNGTALRSRGVGPTVLVGQVDVSPPPPRLVADWERDMATLLEPGEVEALPLARARMRWPDYRQCVAALEGWTRKLGLGELLAGQGEVALMACRGARYHHDGAQYPGAAFCNLFLGEDQGLDLHFPAAGLRMPLVRGTSVVFDTCQPHAVIRRGSAGFDAAHFGPGQAGGLVFLTWELPIDDSGLAQALGVDFDTDPGTAQGGEEDEQLWWNGQPAEVCPASGRWRTPD